MSADSAQILRRKLHVPEAKSPLVDDLGRLARAARKAADMAMGLSLTANDITEKTALLPEVIGEIKNDHLILILAGPSDSQGLVLLDAQFVAAMIEMATIGLVNPSKAEDRKGTATDATLMTPFIDHLFGQIFEQGDSELAAKAAGFGFPKRVSTAAAAELLLGEKVYRRYVIPTDLGGGAKTGEVVLILPDEPARVQGVAAPDPGDWSDSLRDATLELPTVLDAVLHSVGMPLSKVREFAAGDLISVPVDALGNVKIHDVQGNKIATARLGQVNGARAVCLKERSKGSEGVFTLAKQPKRPNPLLPDEMQAEIDAITSLTDGIPDAFDGTTASADLSGLNPEIENAGP